MTDEAARRSELSWLLAPPGASDVHVHVEIGSEVELSESAREALERLLDELQSADVSGFVVETCTDLSANCKPFSCNLKDCQPLVRSPCFVDADCRIVSLA